MPASSSDTPSVRSAVYGGATSEERRAAHNALAGALPKGEADRRAWHRAAAAVEADEEIAGELAATATRAARRGGFAAASLALERAAQLTAGETTRASRLVEAAQASMLAGRFERAMTLVRRAEPLPSDPLLNAEIGLLRGSVELWIGSAPRAVEMFTATAEDVASHDSSKALELLMMAAEAAAMAGTHDLLDRATRIGAGYTADPDNDEEVFSATFLRGLRHFLDGDRASAAPLLRSCLDQARRFDDPRRTLWAAGAAFYLGDREVRQAFLDRTVELTRGAGAIGLLPYPLAWRSGSEFQLGRIAEAAADADEAVTLARDIGLEGATAYPTAILARVAGLQGRDHECRALASEALAVAAAHGLAVAAAHAELARAELALSRGRWAEALDRLEALADVRTGRGHPVFALGTAPDLIEAAVRAGRPRRAREALGPYEEWVRLAGVSWESPRLARCRALLSGAGDAAQYFDEALRFDGTRKRSSIERERSCSTANIFVPGGGAPKRVHSCELRSRHSSGSEPTAGPIAHGRSFRRPARHRRRTTRARSRGSPHRSCRSSGWSPRAIRTGRSRRVFSSRRAPSTCSCVAHSRSSASRRGSSSLGSDLRRNLRSTC